MGVFQEGKSLQGGNLTWSVMCPFINVFIEQLTQRSIEL